MTETQKALALIGIVFSGKLTDEQLKAYEKLLGDIPPEILQKAVLAILQRAKFPPTPGEIREAAEKIYKVAADVKPPDASAAWITAKKLYLNKYGYHRVEEFLEAVQATGDALLYEAVQRVDWRDFSMSDMTEAGNWESRFKKTYKDLAARKEEERRIAPLLADGKIQKLIAGVGDTLSIDRRKEES